MKNVRTIRAAIGIDAPYIPSNVDKKHVGTQVQISRSTDFDNPSYMVVDKKIYLPDNILNLTVEFQGSLDEVLYTRYRCLFDSKSQPTANPDFYTEEQWSRISSVRGDQEGVRLDNVIITTPRVTVTKDSSSILDRKIKISVDGFKVLMGSGNHKYTTWEVVDTDGEVVFQRIKDEDNVNSIRIPEEIFKQGNLYMVKAKFVTDTNAESNYGVKPYVSNLVENGKFDLEPVLPFTQGQSLYFKLKLYTPNVTKLEVIIKEDRNDAEIEIYRKSDFQPTYSICIDKNDIESKTAPGVSYKVYANITATISGRLYQSSTKYITRFTMGKTEIYPINTYSAYPGRYSLLNDVLSSASVVKTMEFKNGTFLLADNSQTGFSLYGKYGDTLRESNVKIELPTGKLVNSTEFPYINILPLYDDNVLINYTIFNTMSYKSSVWAIYRPDLANYTFKLLDYKIFDDEKYSTSINSSAVVAKDGWVYYIPANYTLTVPNNSIPNMQAKFLARNINTTDRTFSPFIKGDHFTSSPSTWNSSTKTHYEFDGELINYRTTATDFSNNECLSIDVTDFTANVSNGFTIQIDIKMPLNNSTDYRSNGNWPGMFSLTDASSNNIVFSFGSDVSSPEAGKTAFNCQCSGQDGTNGIDTKITNGELVRISFVVTSDRFKVFFNNLEVKSRTCNRALDYGKKFWVGWAKNYSMGSEFSIKSISFYDEPFTVDRLNQPDQPDEALEDIDLPMFRIKYDGSRLVREQVLSNIIPGVKRNVSMCPLGDFRAGQEEFLIVGGTDSTKIHVQDQTGADIPNVYYYHLSNRQMYRFSTSTQSIAEINGAVIPPSIPREYYSPEVQLRADGKIAMFNNAIHGPESTNSVSYLLDFSEVLDPVKFFVKENNESTVDLPFRSTVRMRNGDFIRISHYDLSVSKGLIYPHDSLPTYNDAEITINKNLVVPIGTVITVPNLYVYDSVTIEGNYDPVTQEHNTGILRWIDINKVRTFDYRDRIVTRDTTVTSAEDRATPKERLFVLEGVNYTVRD